LDNKTYVMKPQAGPQIELEW